jgi:hypothetical protein
VVLFGGRTSTSALNGDTWEWDGTNWTQFADTGPDARGGHQLVFDDQRSWVVLFGGEAGNGALRRDTWEWDGQTWTQRDDAGPTARQQHAMAFDTSRKRVVLFGGDLGATTASDTWEWDGTSWTQVADTGPDPCAGAAMAFDGSGVLLFGGAEALAASKANPPRLFGLSWEWDGQHWTTLQDIGPTPRWGHAVAFDSSRSRPVLFGGLSVGPGDATASQRVLADTWETSVTPAADPGGVHRAPLVPTPPAAKPDGSPQLTAFTVSPDTVTFDLRQGNVTSNNMITVGIDRPAQGSIPVAVSVPLPVPAGAVLAAQKPPISASAATVDIPPGQSAGQVPLELPSSVDAKDVGWQTSDVQLTATLGNSTRTTTIHLHVA